MLRDQLKLETLKIVFAVARAVIVETVKAILF
jgi:hypothetical protein